MLTDTDIDQTGHVFDRLYHELLSLLVITPCYVNGDFPYHISFLTQNVKDDVMYILHLHGNIQ